MNLPDLYSKVGAARDATGSKASFSVAEEIHETAGKVWPRWSVCFTAVVNGKRWCERVEADRPEIALAKFRLDILPLLGGDVCPSCGDPMGRGAALCGTCSRSETTQREYLPQAGQQQQSHACPICGEPTTTTVGRVGGKVRIGDVRCLPCQSKTVPPDHGYHHGPLACRQGEAVTSLPALAGAAPGGVVEDEADELPVVQTGQGSSEVRTMASDLAEGRI